MVIAQRGLAVVQLDLIWKYVTDAAQSPSQLKAVSRNTEKAKNVI
jgi:hypothetical protein